MLLYSLIILITVCFALSAELLRRKSLFLFIFFSSLAVVFPSFIAGCRDWSVGFDVMYYGYEFYLTSKYSDTFLELIKNCDTDWLYLFVNYISAKLIGTFNFSLGVISFFTLLFVYMALNKYRGSISIFFAYGLYLIYMYSTSMNLLRQCLAVSICFYAVSLLEGKFGGWRFWFFFVLSCLAHKTAIFGGVFLFILNYALYVGENAKRKIWVCLTIGCILLVLFLAYVLEIISNIKGLDKYMTYANSVGEEGWRRADVSQTLVIFVLFFLIMVVIDRFFVKIWNDNVLSYNLSLICIAMLSTLCLGIYTLAATRMSFYFVLPLIVCISRIVKSLYISKGSRYIISIFILLLLFVVSAISYDTSTSYSSKILGI